MYTLAIETGGTKLQMILGTPDGRIAFKHFQKVVPSLGHKGTLEAIEGALPMLRGKAAELGGGVLKVALGFGGIVDYKRGILTASEQISGWNRFPLRGYLEKKTGLPSFVFNDTDSATWGEYALGAGRGSSVFMYTNIGSGIGGGLVAGGRLYVGQGHGAVEIGQTFVQNLDSENAMDFIQLERICSGWGIESRLKRAELPADSLLRSLCGNAQDTLTCQMLAEAVNEDDPFATEFFDRTVRAYSAALANAISMLAPEVVAIGGGVSLIGEPLFSRIEKYVAEYAANNVKGHYRIVGCELGEEVVPVGAMMLADSVERALPEIC